MYKCPECGSTGLEVVALVRCSFVQDTEFDEITVTPLDDEQPEWEYTSGMECCECGYEDDLGSFEEAIENAATD